MPSPGRNVKWVFPTGVRTNGSPVVARGRVIIGSGLKDYFPDKRRSQERGCGRLLCLDEQTGGLLWHLVMPQLPEKLAPHSDSGYGVCSTPAVEGDRVYVVSSRGEVLCLDLHGQANGNDGPFKDEGAYLAGLAPKTYEPKPPVPVKQDDGDILWLYDMIRELKVHPHDASSSSVLIHGGLLYVSTGNGRAGNDRDIPGPLAPSLIALDKQTGRLLAQDDEKIGTRLLKGQWSSPALCKLADRELIIYGAGDGFCYAFKPAAAAADGPVATLEKVWAADCNPPEFRSRDGKPIGYMRKGKEGPCEIIATPVCWKGRVYVPIGREPIYGPGAGCLSCINGADGRVLWRSTEVGRSLSTVAIADGRLYAADLSGMLHCLDPDTGRHHWKHRVGRAVWASPHVADYKAYVATTSGLTVMPLGETPLPTRPIGLRNIAATPCTANGVLYVASQQYLYAVCQDDKEREK